MAAVESGSWHIHESRDGKGSLYEITSQGLTVGRHADADIIVHVSSTRQGASTLVMYDNLLVAVQDCRSTPRTHPVGLAQQVLRNT